MNVKNILAAVAVLAAANTAFAAEWTDFTNIRSTRTRAEVQAELKQAKADGSYTVAGQEYEGQFRATGNDAGTRLAGEARAVNAN